MYDNIEYMGKTLKEWQAVFNNVFSLGELYQMMLKKVNFNNILKVVDS